MRIAVFTFLVFLVFHSFGQDTRLVTKKSNDFNEEYYVLKSNKKIKDGAYKKSIANMLVMEGQYSNNQKIGEWKFYSNGQIETVYDYSSKEIKKSRKPENLFHVFINGVEKDTELDTPPLFLGGDDELNIALKKNIQYPTSALRIALVGEVFVQFWVSEDNAISDAKILKGFDKSCDDESLRAITKVTEDWVAGTKDGKKIKSLITVVFRFMLNSWEPTIDASILEGIVK